ncbi:MAG: DUF2165 domain-containing protein [Pseudomonas sp.]
MWGRLIKFGLVLQVGVFLLLVSVNNLLDFDTNFAFVQHVLAMDTLSGSTALNGRAISSPTLHLAAYGLIISAEIVAGLCCLAGALRLWRGRHLAAGYFQHAKQLAALGLALAFSLWFFGFMVVGGEWFEMWRSPTWNGQQAAFRFIGCVGLVLVLLMQKDDELG